MCASFKDAFKKKAVRIPSSVLEVLAEKELPKGFRYKEIEPGLLCVTTENMKIDIRKENLEIPANLEDKSFSEILEYAYLTQSELKIKGEVYINGSKFNISKLVKKPFDIQNLNIDNGILRIVPEPFKEFELEIKSGELRKIIKIKRQPYYDIEKAYFKRIDSDGLEISYTVINKKSVDFDIKVDVDKCKNVKKVIENLEMCKGFYEGNFMINGQKLPIDKVTYDRDILDNMINIYKKIEKIDDLLNIDIKPSKDINIEDIECINILYRTLIENKPYKEYGKIDKINLSTTQKINEEIFKEGYSGAFQFASDIELNLLGSVIKLKTIIVIYNIEISDIKEVIKDNGFDYEIKLDNIEDRKIYQSILHFKDEEAYHSYINNKNIVNDLSNAEELNI